MVIMDTVNVYQGWTETGTGLGWDWDWVGTGIGAKYMPVKNSDFDVRYLTKTQNNNFYTANKKGKSRPVTSP